MPVKERFCFNCGKSLGSYADWDQFDDCGERECASAHRDAAAQERAEAHEQLDRDRGWGRW